jgi:hypothetical protein
MVFENITTTLILAGIAGLTVSGLTALGNENKAWVWRKFAYSLGIATVSAVVVIDGLNVQLTEANLIATFVTVIGSSFLGNKLVTLASKLKND